MDKTGAGSAHQAVWDWMQECEYAGRLFFNFGDTQSGSTILLPTDTMIEEYLDGSQLRRYAVELIRFLPVSWEANDTGNIEMLDQIEHIIEWLQAQEAAGNYPEFPEGMQAIAIRVLETEAGYAAASDGVHAKYVLPFSIEYFRGMNTNR